MAFTIPSAVTIGTNVYVSPQTYANLSVNHQIQFITEQTREGRTVLVQNPPQRVNIHNTEEVIRLAYSQPNSFVQTIKANYPQANDQTLVALSQAATSFTIALQSVRNQVQDVALSGLTARPTIQSGTITSQGAALTSLSVYPYTQLALNCNVGNTFSRSRHRDPLIKRKVGDNTYAITESEAKTLFNKVLLGWSQNNANLLPRAEDNARFTATRAEEHRVVYHLDRIQIGCQTIGRWELEALARYAGFDGVTPFSI